jgi:hypothetical protein
MRIAIVACLALLGLLMEATCVWGVLALNFY